MSPPPPRMDIASFAQTQLSLLDAELAAEIAETAGLVANHSPQGLQRAGVALANLTAGSQRTGFGGRTVLELVSDPAVSSSEAGADGQPLLPEHGIRVGDVVVVAEQPSGSARKREVGDLEKKGASGVVSKVKRESVSVALGEEKEDVAASLGGRLWVVKLADDVTYKRYGISLSSGYIATHSSIFHSTVCSYHCHDFWFIYVEFDLVVPPSLAPKYGIIPRDVVNTKRLRRNPSVDGYNRNIPVGVDDLRLRVFCQMY